MGKGSVIALTGVLVALLVIGGRYLATVNPFSLQEVPQENKRPNPNNQKGASMSLLRKTFFGLTFSYYFRNLIFAGIVAALQYNYQKTGTNVSTVLPMALLVVNTFLYPYSRFAYESVMGFFMGNNVFILPLIIMLPYKLFSIMLCWFMATFISPIGLIFIWFQHSKEG